MHAPTNASSNLVLFLTTGAQFFGVGIDRQARTTTLGTEIATANCRSHRHEYRQQPYRTPSVAVARTTCRTEGGYTMQPQRVTLLGKREALQ